MTRKKRRLTFIAAAGVLLAASTALVLAALRDQIVFFYSPTEIVERAPDPGTRLRLGGLVAEGSVRRAADGNVSFVITDTATRVAVSYRGILPDLFRERQDRKSTRLDFKHANISVGDFCFEKKHNT